jgi:hypothetical protein
MNALWYLYALIVGVSMLHVMSWMSCTLSDPQSTFNAGILHVCLGLARQVRTVGASGCRPSHYGRHRHRGLKGGVGMFTVGICYGFLHYCVV